MKLGNRVGMLPLAFIVACSASGSVGEQSRRDGRTDQEPGGGPSTSRPDDANPAPGDLGGDGNPSTPPTQVCDVTDPHADHDGDGYSIAQGDCNDCDPNVNPGAYDVPGNGVDEDCNGIVDDEPELCDWGLPIKGDDPMDAARAIGLCRVAEGESWGVISAKWTGPDGNLPVAAPEACKQTGNNKQPPTVFPHPDSRGLLPKFGHVVRPQEGDLLLALSSGIAREGINDFSPMGEFMCTMGKAPPGFPQDAPDCPGVTTSSDTKAFDAIALELKVKVPTNAHGLSFLFNFFTYEWPDYVCKQYNDFFVALLDSKHPATPSHKNISFDSKGAPVSVNNAFVEVCELSNTGPVVGGKTFSCKLGPGELKGTGFDASSWGGNHAATSWRRRPPPSFRARSSRCASPFGIWATRPSTRRC